MPFWMFCPMLPSPISKMQSNALLTTCAGNLSNLGIKATCLFTKRRSLDFSRPKTSPNHELLNRHGVDFKSSR